MTNDTHAIGLFIPNPQVEHDGTDVDAEENFGSANLGTRIAAENAKRNTQQIPDPFAEDQTQDIERIKRENAERIAQKERDACDIDRELVQKFQFHVLGDKILVRPIDEGPLLSDGGIFLSQGNTQTQRCVIVATGGVDPKNRFAAPIMKRITNAICSYSRVEALIATTRQDSHEYHYKGQVYLFVPCVFFLAVEGMEPAKTPVL